MASLSLPHASNASQLRELVSHLQAPIQDATTLLSYLSAPLGTLGLLPADLRRYNVSPLRVSSADILKHIPSLQRAILQHVLPAWAEELAERKLLRMVDLYICPDTSTSDSLIPGEIALQAYSTLLSLPIDKHSIRLLTHLSNRFNVDVLHDTVYSQQQIDSVKKEAMWEDCIRDLVAVPAKVANGAVAGQLEAPIELGQGPYFDRLSVSFDELIVKLSGQSGKGT